MHVKVWVHIQALNQGHYVMADMLLISLRSLFGWHPTNVADECVYFNRKVHPLKLISWPQVFPLIIFNVFSPSLPFLESAD